ncbi:hypothetical protein BS78_10G140200 [Paspalum vaginatum]|nr:hypothetical protein BS78_10G140200 [Paspalum vaginatum]
MVHDPTTCVRNRTGHFTRRACDSAVRSQSGLAEFFFPLNKGASIYCFLINETYLACFGTFPGLIHGQHNPTCTLRSCVVHILANVWWSVKVSCRGSVKKNTKGCPLEVYSIFPSNGNM